MQETVITPYVAFSTLIETYVSVVPALESGRDVYINEKQAARTVPGGFLIAQATLAATFIRPIRDDVEAKIAYHVQSAGDGRIYATRMVSAFEGPECVYTASVSFQNTMVPAANLLQYQRPKPDVDGNPEDIVHQADDARVTGLEVSEHSSDSKIRCFVRSPKLSSADAAVRLAAPSFLSDQFSIGIAVAANPSAMGKRMRNVALATSLTHNISFHDPNVRVDEWLFVERETSWGLWSLESGTMVLEGVQEALFRLKDSKL
ncbi:Thioesterase/thiol ester dehydrase-isomerase [Xylariaceae sp. FL1272]|nr:Thioesterase/thiol ester dehydrase-isomerase [Xylariaceae sp. FL1272]